MTEKRPHADLAIKFYSDTKMKCWFWDKRTQTWLRAVRPGWDDSRIYEVSETKPTYKPEKKVTLAGITFNAPESVEPELNTTYWVPTPLNTASLSIPIKWTLSAFNRKSLADGFVHLKEEDATLHASALIKLSKELK